ncbi:apolipoprotein A-II [Rhinichthys klamathensis goyatoka]|uniref:apolipoprotein A-II n=1 Tax=Rhinichthys klamathensis goyatoka TaxID=3034132 RepID=UPI0024B52F31|nr:apolipoprotein A-II [Rhinichthys klamathensis goyatoka]
MKLTFALILALQVSVCVWAQQWPEPDKELVEKYEGLKAVFFKRIVTAWEKVKDSAQPMLESSPSGGRAQEIYDELKKSPRMESAVKIISGLVSEMEPVVDKARLALLGAYGHYLRPYVGEHLDKAITSIKPVLDTVLPQGA